MSVTDLLSRLRNVLEASETPYMLTGSFASSIHGQPRATQDIDIVIAPTRAASRTASAIRKMWVAELGLQAQWNDALSKAV